MSIIWNVVTGKKMVGPLVLCLVYPASGVIFNNARTIGCWILGIKDVIIYCHFSDLTLHIQQLETRQTQKNLKDTS